MNQTEPKLIICNDINRQRETNKDSLISEILLMLQSLIGAGVVGNAGSVVRSNFYFEHNLWYVRSSMSDFSGKSKFRYNLKEILNGG